MDIVEVSALMSITTTLLIQTLLSPLDESEVRIPVRSFCELQSITKLKLERCLSNKYID